MSLCQAHQWPTSPPSLLLPMCAQDVCSDSHWVQEAASSASAAAAGQASGLGAVEVLERVVADASALVGAETYDTCL
jgi:hypothetical protein